MQCAATLMAARPSLTAPLLRGLLLGHRCCLTSPAAVTSSSDTQPVVRDDGLPPCYQLPRVSVGSVASAHLLQSGCSACLRLAGVCERTECLAIILQAVPDIIFTASAAIMTDANAAVCCEKSNAAGIACDALTQLLGNWPAINHASAAGCETYRHTDLQSQLQRIRHALDHLASQSLQPMLQPLQPQAATSTEDGDGTAAARQLFQSCCSLRIQLARLGVQPSLEQSVSAPMCHLPPIQQSDSYAIAAPGASQRTPDWQLPDWLRALRIGASNTGAARERNSRAGGNSGGNTEGIGSQGCCTAKSAAEECILAEAMVRAMPGQKLRCNELQVQIPEQYFLCCVFLDRT